MEQPLSIQDTSKSQADGFVGLASLYAADPTLYGGLKKKERLYLKKHIDLLFDKTNPSVSAFTQFPLRVLFCPLPGDLQLPDNAPAEILFSVSKRYFKRAVRRNRAKRQMREAYRLLRAPLMQAIEQDGRSFLIAFVWLSYTPRHSEKVARSMQQCIHTLIERIQNKTTESPANHAESSNQSAERPNQNPESSNLNPESSSLNTERPNQSTESPGLSIEKPESVG